MSEKQWETVLGGEPSPEDYGPEDFGDSTFCECGLDPTEDEEASSTCSCCGRPLVSG